MIIHNNASTTIWQTAAESTNGQIFNQHFDFASAATNSAPDLNVLKSKSISSAYVLSRRELMEFL